MAKLISTWKIVRGILSICESQTDIAEVIKTLQNKNKLEEMIEVLYDLDKALNSDRVLIPKNVVEADKYTQKNQVKLLYTLFRERLNMSNQDVEVWLFNKFSVKHHIGKSSLVEYLQLILKNNPAEMTRAILTEASKEFGSLLGGDRDLRKFWEGLDARSNGDNNSVIQGRTNPVSPQSEEPRRIF